MRRVLSTILGTALVLAIVGLLTAIWLPGLIVRQPPSTQEIVAH